MNKIYTLLATALLFPSTTLADDNDSAYAYKVNLQELYVTGFKNVGRQNLAAAVTSLSGNFLADNEVKTLRETGGLIPNVFLPDFGSRQASPVYIRGIGSRKGNPSVAFYVDGVPYFSSSAFDFDLNDVAAVEVLRGPQGTLFGRNAIAGVINITSRSPLTTQRTLLKAGYGRFGDVYGGVSSLQKLGEKAGISLAATYHRNNGNITNTYTNKKADGLQEGNGRLAFDVLLSETWKMKVFSAFNYSQQDGYPYAKLDLERREVAPVAYNSPSNYRRVMSTSGLNFTYGGPAISFQSQTAYQFTDDRMFIDQDFTPAPLYFVTNTTRNRTFSQEFTLKGNPDRRYRWLVGAFGFYQDGRNNIYLDLNAPTRSTQSTKLTHEVDKAFAFYHESAFDLTRRLSATAGVRFDREFSSSVIRSFPTARPSQVVLDHSPLTFSKFTYKIGLQYTLNNGSMLYATHATGYKAGGSNVTFIESKQRTFQPESSENFEAGAKLLLPALALQADVAVFYTLWKNQQITRYMAGQGNMIDNAGKAESKGLELSLQSKPLTWLTLMGNYGLTLARFKEYNVVETIDKKKQEVDCAGNRIPLVPQHTLGMNASLAMSPQCAHRFGLDAVHFTIGADGVGRIYFDETNRAGQPFYLMMNSKLSFTKGVCTLELWGRNLTATRYIAFAYKQADYVSFNAQQGRPMSWGASFTVTL